ncbi:polysaccharide pyruvyl transferase family protein [Dactylosporangium sp. CA-092794]|uniref:polysaccharide pyruvyl transferase family protein n=1 Tax=Dactylosporangium sp. CA-092794 TaxID=3239929 RepID=UPI003D923B4B
MHILVECSGYELLNLGDMAMLVAGYERLQKLWPHATMHVVTNSPQRLAEHCPGAVPVPLGWPTGALRTVLSHRGRVALSWAHKVLAPELIARLAPPDALLDPVRRADVVVSTGGGFVNDSFRLHAAGVLNLLAAAQRLGRPTAMFGQGIGPLTSRPVLRRARLVLPRLRTLGMREPTSAAMLRAMGVPARVMSVTGDDALALAGAGRAAAVGTALGVNVRVTRYTGMDSAVVQRLRREVTRFAAAEVAPGGRVVSLPISRHGDEDLRATESVLPELPAVESVSADIHSPAQLADAVAGCRAVLTSSYHAGVFALARGIPVVGLSRSSYYDLKFEALRVLFPDGACNTVRLDAHDWPDTLADRLSHAWHAPYELRTDITAAAARMADSSQRLYERFAAEVDPS